MMKSTSPCEAPALSFHAYVNHAVFNRSLHGLFCGDACPANDRAKRPLVGEQSEYRVHESSLYQRVQFFYCSVQDTESHCRETALTVIDALIVRHKMKAAVGL